MGEWHYAALGKPVGPVTVEEIGDKFREGIIERDTLVWTVGMPEWRPINEIDDFNGLTLENVPPPLPHNKASVPCVEPPSLSKTTPDKVHSDVKDWVEIPNLNVSEARIPWSRYFARMFDVSVLGTLMLSGAIVISSYTNPSVYLTLYTADPRALLLLALPFVMVLNAVIITIFGNSLGKKLFGIYTVNCITGQPFSLIGNIVRELRVWARGLALGLPIINLFTMVPAYRRVVDGKPTLYDEGIASVRTYSNSPARRAVGIILTLLVLIGIVASNTVEKRNLERVSRPYSWNNPQTKIPTTIPAGWQQETMAGPQGPLYTFTNLNTGVVAFFAVETSAQHTLVSYADALELALSKTMKLDEWNKYDLPEVWKRDAVMKEGNYPAVILLRRQGSSFWRVVYVDQVGKSKDRSDVNSPELTKALFDSLGEP